MTGIHVDDDAQQLADALVRLAEDPDERRRMSEAARRTAQRQFGLGPQAKRVEAFYERLLASSK